MDPKPLSWVLRTVGGRPCSAAEAMAGVQIRGVSTDTREIGEGDLFVALRGERFDGHRFVGEAFRRGAAAAVISSDVAEIGGFRDRPVIRVPDTRRALGLLAHRHRRELGARIVAVTGSAGKTTVKDLVAHLARSAGPLVKARRSFNNEIGVPLTLLSMGGDTRVGVLELGTNRPGEIAALARIVAPDVGVVTNVGDAHLGAFGSRQGVAEEKGALVQALPRRGIAFLNHEDYLCREMARQARCGVIRYGFDPAADLWGLKRTRDEEGISFYLYGKMPMRLPVPGLHNASNALAAVGVALWLGISPAEIRERLATFRLPEMRLTRTRRDGVTYLNDAYNANPSSVKVAIDELRAQPGAGRRILVIGDMHELGAHCGRAHRQVGVRAARAGIHVVWAVGEQAAEVERGCRSVTRWTGRVFRSPSTEAAMKEIPFELRAGDTVLVKGSRRMGLERLFDRILEAGRAGEPARVPAGAGPGDPRGH